MYKLNSHIFGWESDCYEGKTEIRNHPNEKKWNGFFKNIRSDRNFKKHSKELLSAAEYHHTAPNTGGGYIR